MVGLAMDISEEFGIPVVLRPAIRVCHARQNITFDSLKSNVKKSSFEKDPQRWVGLPRYRLVLHRELNKKLEGIRKRFESLSQYNFHDLAPGRKYALGIVAGGVPYDPFNLARMKELLPEGASWSVCGVGPNQFAGGMTAAVNGGHIRVGLEDNVRMANGDLAKGSYEQVQWAVQVARLAGREVASPDEARQIFHIPKRS